VVGGFEVRADFFEGEPGGFELAKGVEFGLIGVVFALRMPAGAEGVDGEGTHLGGELDHAYVGGAGDAVEAFLAGSGGSVEGVDGAVAAVYAGDGKARTGVVELFVEALVEALEADEIAPGYAPTAEILFECVEGFVKCCYAELGRHRLGAFGPEAIAPTVEYGHCERACGSAVIPGGEEIVDFTQTWRTRDRGCLNRGR